MQSCYKTIFLSFCFSVVYFALSGKELPMLSASLLPCHPGKKTLTLPSACLPPPAQSYTYRVTTFHYKAMNCPSKQVLRVHRFVTFQVFGVYSYCVIQSFICFVYQNNEVTSECGDTGGAEADLSLRHCLYITLLFAKFLHTFLKYN